MLWRGLSGQRQSPEVLLHPSVGHEGEHPSAFLLTELSVSMGDHVPCFSNYSSFDDSGHQNKHETSYVI